MSEKLTNKITNKIIEINKQLSEKNLPLISQPLSGMTYEFVFLNLLNNFSEMLKNLK